MNKKIAFIGNTDWYLSNFRGPLIRAAQETGWQPVLVCPAGRYADQMAAEGHAVHRLALNNDGMNPLRELRVLYQLWRLLRRERPAIIHLFTLKCVLYGALVAPFAGRPATIAAITGMGTLFTSQGWRSRLLRPPVLIAIRLALRVSRAHVVFQNTHDRDECVQWRLIPRERTSVIRGSGVDCERFCPDENSQHRPGQPPRLLFAARLLQEKGINEYLEATARLRGEGHNFISRIAGDAYPGNPSSLTQSEVDTLARDPRHEYLGHRDDMPEILRQCDIFVLPTYREGTPKSVLEAAASGCVIVTTDIPGCAGLVEEGVNGYLIPPRDTQALTDTLRQLIDMASEKRREMGHAGREIMQKNFSTETVNNATLKIYDRVTTRSL